MWVRAQIFASKTNQNNSISHAQRDKRIKKNTHSLLVTSYLSIRPYSDTIPWCIVRDPNSPLCGNRSPGCHIPVLSSPLRSDTARRRTGRGRSTGQDKRLEQKHPVNYKFFAPICDGCCYIESDSKNGICEKNAGVGNASFGFGD